MPTANRSKKWVGQNANTNTGEKGRARETSLEITNGVGFVSAPRTFARA